MARSVFSVATNIKMGMMVALVAVVAVVAVAVAVAVAVMAVVAVIILIPNPTEFMCARLTSHVIASLKN